MLAQVLAGGELLEKGAGKENVAQY